MPADRTAASAPKLLLFTDNFEQGGSQLQLVQLANVLNSDSSFQVHVGCISRRGDLLRLLEVPEERVREFPLRRFYSAGGLRQIARLAYYVFAERFMIVHAQDFYANVICTAAAALLPTCRLVVSRRYETLSNRRVHRWGERWCYRFADAVVTNSRNVCEALIGEGLIPGAKAVVIPNGIDLARFAGCDRTDGPVEQRRPGSLRIGIVASLCRDKGHDTLLRATEKLVQKWPELELTLVGDGELRFELSKLAEQLRIQPHVRLVGSQQDIRPWVVEFDVAVLSSYREGLPNALLEYLACRRPVVATRVGGIPEVVRDRQEALLVAPGDAEGLAAAIDSLLSDKRRRARLGAAGRRRVAEYGLARMVERTRALYERLLGDTMPVSTRARSNRAALNDVWHQR